MTVNHLLLTDVKKEEQDDDLLSSLTNIAYATPQSLIEQPKQSKIKQSNRKSRFFFTPTESFSTEVNKSKKAVRKSNTALTILDAEVETRQKAYAKELHDALKFNIETVREFFLSEIGPLTLAAQAGTVQASQVMQRVLNTEIDGQVFLQFERMVGKASTLKMARFIAKYLELPTRTIEELLQVVQPPAPKEVLFMNSNPFDDRRPRKEKIEQKSE